jgi:hypothetical protein
MPGEGLRDGVLLSENVGCLGTFSCSRLQGHYRTKRNASLSPSGVDVHSWRQGPLAEAETVFELRLPLTSMLFRIVRSLKNSSYQSKRSRTFSPAARS